MRKRYVIAYHKFEDELTITNNGVLWRDTRIVIPKFLQNSTLAIAHEGHQGIAKIKVLVRTKVGWPRSYCCGKSCKVQIASQQLAKHHHLKPL
jgi:hypothetical protein